MKENVIDARWIGGAFAGDPELKLPERPRIPPEILVIPFGADALILAGARDHQMLKGRTTRTLLPRVLPLLDGEHTLEDLVASFPAEPEHAVRDIVTLLYSRGLLEDGRAGPPPAQLRSVDAFLGRFTDVTRLNRNRGEALRRLEQARVRVGGDPTAAAELVASLAASGVGDPGLVDPGTQPGGCDLLVSVVTGFGEEDESILDAAHREQVVSLGAWLGRDAVLLGPLSLPGQSSCYRCLRERGLPEGRPAAHVRRFWVQMAAVRAIHYLSRISAPPGFESYLWVSLQPDGAVTESRALPRTPECAGCGLPGPAIERTDSAFQAWSLYNATSKPPVHLLGSKDYEAHYSPKNIELARQEAPICAGAATLALPEPRPLPASPWDPPPGKAGSLDAADLATLLHRAAGLHGSAGSVRRRVAPTGGDLGSVELGVVVTAVAGVPPGIYRYHAPRHVLERFPELAQHVIERALGARASLPPAVVIGIGGLAKVVQKYGAFAYRIVHFDAGVAAAYLHRLAPALGLSVEEYPEFRDDSLAEMLLMDFDHAIRLPTFAIGISSGPATETPGEPAMLMRVIEAARSSAAPTATPRVRSNGRPIAPAAGFDSILFGRRAVRSYSSEPIAAEVLRDLCRLGIEAAGRRIDAGLPACTAVGLVLAIADGASDLPGGIYRVDPDRPELLVPGRRGLIREDLVSCLLQSMHAAAPAALFTTADLGAVLAARGARGLREVMVQAGAAVGEVWLAATAYGLGACASGGVIEVGLQALAGADGYRRAALLAITLGHPLP